MEQKRQAGKHAAWSKNKKFKSMLNRATTGIEKACGIEQKQEIEKACGIEQKQETQKACSME